MERHRSVRRQDVEKVGPRRGKCDAGQPAGGRDRPYGCPGQSGSRGPRCPGGQNAAPGVCSTCRPPGHLLGRSARQGSHRKWGSRPCHGTAFGISELRVDRRSVDVASKPVLRLAHCELNPLPNSSTVCRWDRRRPLCVLTATRCLAASMTVAEPLADNQRGSAEVTRTTSTNTTRIASKGFPMLSANAEAVSELVCPIRVLWAPRPEHATS